MDEIINLCEKYDDLLKVQNKIDDIIVNKLKNSLDKMINFKGNEYKKCIYTDKDLRFDIYLLKWCENKKIQYHDHSENGCILTMLKGNLKEYRKNKKGDIKEFFIKENDVSYIDNSLGLHKVLNLNNFTCYSLHIYSPAGYKTNYY